MGVRITRCICGLHGAHRRHCTPDPVSSGAAGRKSIELGASADSARWVAPPDAARALSRGEGGREPGRARLEHIKKPPQLLRGVSAGGCAHRPDQSVAEGDGSVALRWMTVSVPRGWARDRRAPPDASPRPAGEGSPRGRVSDAVRPHRSRQSFHGADSPIFSSSSSRYGDTTSRSRSPSREQPPRRRRGRRGRRGRRLCGP